MPTKYSYTEEFRNEFATLKAAGKNPDEIAEAMGISSAQQVRKIRRRLELPRFKRRITYPSRASRVDPEEFKRLFEQGAAREELAEHFRVSPGRVTTIRGELGLPPFPRRNGYRLKPELKERSENVRVMFLNGATTKEICRELALTPSKVEHSKRYLRDTGQLPPTNRGRPMDEERAKRVAEMVEEGASYNDICRTVGVSVHYVRNHHPGRGWTPQQTAEYRHMKEKLDKLG